VTIIFIATLSQSYNSLLNSISTNLLLLLAPSRFLIMIMKLILGSTLPSPAKDFGWHDPGFIHTAVMTGLQPSSNFSYRYGRYKYILHLP